MKFKKPKFAAIVQARQTSTRLPGKALMELAGVPCIAHVINRLKRAEYVDLIVVAMPNTPDNLELKNYCTDVLGCTIYLGPEDDVLSRVLQAAKCLNVENIVDITADCPLVDPYMVDAMIGSYIEYKFEYFSNVFPRMWPDGFDVQIYSTQLLGLASEVVNNSVHRKHVGWNIPTYREEIQKKRPGNKPIRMDNLLAPNSLIHPDWRLTLDTKEDAQVLDHLFDILRIGKEPTTSASAISIIQYLQDHQGILEWNSSVVGKIPGEG
jgi:spore coat polysaccharide biosynthesis protein SpsF